MAERPHLVHLAELTKKGTLLANESYTSVSNPEFTRLP